MPQTLLVMVLTLGTALCIVICKVVRQLPLEVRFAHRTISARAVALTASAEIVVVFGDPKPGIERAEARHRVLFCPIDIPFVALCVFLAQRRGGFRKALLLVIAGGMLFGVAVIAVIAATVALACASTDDSRVPIS
ncbi:hypothetical protein QMK17_07715 [Rhodococcus sp. G-MC3]|uniref:hypothetical protein n=1 Tax=Rhodococcus sp. G-MC3 TaxID=3046209 RepID=UPI0024BA9857|nr:hypothetical protein [Rhodococcus sp. G-MC3]MDJ0393216.1 hypothetical protein [Rhodococcus sp. G-MC3]